MKIFISHSSQNKEIVQLFGNFLLSLDDDIEIFCSSMENQLQVGDNFMNQIINGLKDCEIFIPILSEEYLKSKFCLMELGAAWIKLCETKEDVLDKYILPAVLYPVPRTALSDTPLTNIQTVDLVSIEGVNSIIKRFHEIGILPLECSDYLKRVPEFVEDLDKIIFSTNSGNFLRRARMIAVSENGNPDSIVLNSDVENNAFNLNIDFSTNEIFTKMPAFISFVMQFVRKLNLTSVVNSVEEDTSFSFIVDNLDNVIKGLNIEFKFGENIRILDSITLKVEPGINEFDIPFNSLNKDGWDELSEICFVIKPMNLVKRSGSIIIKDIRVKKNEAK